MENEGWRGNPEIIMWEEMESTFYHFVSWIQESTFLSNHGKSMLKHYVLKQLSCVGVGGNVHPNVSTPHQFQPKRTLT